MVLVYYQLAIYGIGILSVSLQLIDVLVFPDIDGISMYGCASTLTQLSSLSDTVAIVI